MFLVLIWMFVCFVWVVKNGMLLYDDECVCDDDDGVDGGYEGEDCGV